MRGNTVDILSPKNDFVFKQLFGDALHTAPLAAFLQAVLGLPEEEFAGLAVGDPNLNREYGDDKLCVLDVRVATRSGRDVDVEIQLRPSDELCDRIQCYVARMAAEKVKSGEDYRNLPQSVSIVIVDHRLWRGDEGRYHHRFRLYDAEAKLAYPNSIEIHTLELPKIPKNSDGTSLWNWLRFISSKTQEEIMPLAEKDPVISEALWKLMDMSGDLTTRRRAEARAKFLWDQAAWKRQGIREGRAEGLAEGRAEGLAEGRVEGRAEGLAEGRAEGETKKQLEIIRRMMQKNMSLAEISELTGSSLPELERLTKNL